MRALGMGSSTGTEGTQLTSVHRSSQWAHNTCWMEQGVELSTQATSSHISDATTFPKPVLAMAWQGTVRRRPLFDHMRRVWAKLSGETPGLVEPDKVLEQHIL